MMKLLTLSLVLLVFVGCYTNRFYSSQQYYNGVESTYQKESQNSIIDTLNDIAIRLTIPHNEYNYDNYIRYEFKKVDSSHWEGQKLEIRNMMDIRFKKKILWIEKELTDTTPLIFRATKTFSTDTFLIKPLMDSCSRQYSNFHQDFIHFRNNEHLLEFFKNGKCTKINYNDLGYQVLKENPELANLKELHELIIHSFTLSETIDGWEYN